MSAKMTSEQLGAKIADARHEAEGLKDRIKRRKDELADTTRKGLPSSFTPYCSMPVVILVVVDPLDGVIIPSRYHDAEY